MDNELLNGMEINLEDLEQVSGGTGANQYIKATGDVYVRKYPDKGSADIGVLYKGQKAAFLGEVRKDDRGVAWGKVNFKGSIGWISSKYAKIVNG